MSRCLPISTARRPMLRRCRTSGCRSATARGWRLVSASARASCTPLGRHTRVARTAGCSCRSPAPTPMTSRSLALVIPLGSSRRLRRAATSRCSRNAAGARFGCTSPAASMPVSTPSAAPLSKPSARGSGIRAEVLTMDVLGENRQPSAQKAPPCTLVIFGAGGDLTKRLLMPAIYNLAREKLLPDKFALIAVDRTPKPVDAFRKDLADGIRSFVSDTAAGSTTEPFNESAWEFVSSRITHFAGDLTEPDTYARLHEVYEKTAALHQIGGNAVFYLAVASQLFGTI